MGEGPVLDRSGGGLLTCAGPRGKTHVSIIFVFFLDVFRCGALVAGVAAGPQGR